MGVNRQCLLLATCLLAGCASAPKETVDVDRILKALATGAAVRQQVLDNQRQNAPPPPQVCRWIGPNWVCQ